LDWDEVTELTWLPVCVGLVLVLAPLLAWPAMVLVAWWFGVPISPD
jgi:hypothetical protein